eukprot:4554291-Prymnesium_polylepis.1
MPCTLYRRERAEGALSAVPSSTMYVRCMLRRPIRESARVTIPVLGTVHDTTHGATSAGCVQRPVQRGCTFVRNRWGAGHGFSHARRAVWKTKTCYSKMLRNHNHEPLRVAGGGASDGHG